jgi:hypothetical protein
VFGVALTAATALWPHTVAGAADEAGSITIISQAVAVPGSPADPVGSFSYAGSFGEVRLGAPAFDDGAPASLAIFDALAPGVYALEALDLFLDPVTGDGSTWQLERAECVSTGESRIAFADPAFLTSGVVTIDLAAGDDVVCTFVHVEVLVGPPPRATIGGTVWEDLDGDGIRDDAEPGLDGIAVAAVLLRPDGGTVSPSPVVTTGGTYAVALPADAVGDLEVTVELPAGYRFSDPAAVPAGVTGSDVAADGTFAFRLDASASAATVDAGLVPIAAASPSGADLPRTGFDADRYLLLALVLGGLGGLLLVVTSRRRGGDGE